jgi:DNA-binding MarR family transcriptional regulator
MSSPATRIDPTGVDLRDPVEADIAYRVALAWRELRRGAAGTALRDHFYGANALEQGQIDTLDVLMTRESWRMSELADALHVDPSTATRAVQRLVNDGLAERKPCGDDGRVVRVVPSAAGERQHREISKRRVIALSRLLGAFDAHERRQLADLMTRFVSEVDALADELRPDIMRAGAHTDDPDDDDRSVDPPSH